MPGPPHRGGSAQRRPAGTIRTSGAAWRPGQGRYGQPVGSAPTAIEGHFEVTRADSEAGTSADPADQQGRILTVPNAISVARLAGVPVFLWLVLGPHADGWAVALLIVAGLSDWLDGVIARAWNQQSRLGQVLDPMADRLYIAATLIGLAIRAIIPWWLVAVLVARELVLGVALLVLRRHGYGPLQVSLVGKTATLCLLYAFPLLFLGDHAGTPALVARVIGWAFAIWGCVLYWWAAALYLEQTRRLVRAPGGRDEMMGDAPV
jgi:cardiolipin synthase (CMP-forming)